MSIALCMVVRNEAQFVAAAIESAAPVVDEMIVVDTGSHDDTVALARGAGATVHELPWPGDLGRAHDLPVDLARSDWVFVLDGDELLDPDTRHLLPALAASGDADGYLFTVRNYAFQPHIRWRGVDPLDPLVRGARGWAPSRAVRLYRRHPGIRHRGRVHQSVGPDIAAGGGRIAETTVPIHHYGHIRVDRERGPLYLRLARQQVADTPDDPFAWLDYGLVLQDMVGPPHARHAFERCRALGAEGDGAFAMARALMQMEAYAPALTAVDAAIARRDPVVARYDLADAHEERAEILEALDRPAEAEAAYRAALADRPDSPQAANNLAGLLAERGALDEALAVVEPLVRRYPGLDMPWATLGTVRLRRGEHDAARVALETALDIRPWQVEARANLVVCAREAGRHAEAGRLWRELVNSHAAADLERAGIEAVATPRARAPLVASDDSRALVVSVVPHLAGGGGRVCVDVVHALRDRYRQVVLVGSGGGLHRQGLVEELAALGIPVDVYTDQRALAQRIAMLRPAAVVSHWWSPGPRGPARGGTEPWICVGHAALPMPQGFDRHVVISDFHARLQGHLPPAGLRRIDNPVDLARFPPAVHGEREVVTIVVLARLDPEKFPRRFLHALPALGTLGARVLVAGRGPRRHEIEPELAAHGLEGHVQFLGNVPTQDVPALLASADIGLHLTETHEEILSITLLEMLAAGLPVVTEPKGCVGELIRHGDNGLLARSEAEVARHLERLVSSPSERARMGARSRDRAAAYDFPRYREAWLDLVADTLSDAPRAARTPTASTPSPTTRSLAPGDGLDPIRPLLSYAIATTPRAGSNLLCEALGGTGLAGSPTEHLADGARRSFEVTHGGGGGVDQLAAAVQGLTGPNDVFGTKLLWHQLEALAAPTSGEWPPGGPMDALKLLLPGLRFVRLRRRDRLRQAISLWRAEASGDWVRTEATRGVAPAPTFDRAAIAQRLARLDADEARWDELLADHRPAPFTVWYEDLAADPRGTAVAVLDALGIERPAHLPAPPITTRAQADAATEALVRAWHDTTP
ncbi:MAG: glycosyltransferase [Ectothiorhodospiraceae bacterium]|nr:glycosyltransferase [Ectothiorhodospiraceae bacterium]